MALRMRELTSEEHDQIKRLSHLALSGVRPMLPDAIASTGLFAPCFPEGGAVLSWADGLLPLCCRLDEAEGRLW